MRTHTLSLSHTHTHMHTHTHTHSLEADEGVFNSQLHRRARLLNLAFKSKIIDILSQTLTSSVALHARESIGESVGEGIVFEQTSLVLEHTLHTRQGIVLDTLEQNQHYCNAQQHSAAAAIPVYAAAGIPVSVSSNHRRTLSSPPTLLPREAGVHIEMDSVSPVLLHRTSEKTGADGADALLDKTETVEDVHSHHSVAHVHSANTLQHVHSHANNLAHVHSHTNPSEHHSFNMLGTPLDLGPPRGLQHTATRCSTLQHTAKHCNTAADLRLQSVHLDSGSSTTRSLTRMRLLADPRSLSRYLDSNTLQYTATHCNTLQHYTPHCNTL